MSLYRCLLSSTLFLATAVGQERGVLPTDLTAVFHGNFGCRGAFANGRTIEADVTFEPQLDGKWLAYGHADRPPNGYKARGFWGIDSESSKLTMVLVDIGGGVRLFSSDGWQDNAVTFERTLLPGQKQRRERFRFEKKSANAFQMVYEVFAGENWKIGDSIGCTRD